MNHVSGTKVVKTLMGTGVTAGATVTASVDRIGYDHVTILAELGTSNTVSNNPSVLKISESDITDATGYSDITGLVGDGVGGFTIANADTANANVTVFEVDCRAKKRYLKLTVSPTTTQQVSMTAILSKGDGSVDSATARGVTQVVNG